MERISTLVFLLLLSNLLLIGGCQTSRLTAPEQDNSSNVDYTLVYIVHGDAGYLYHDEEGHPRQADERVVDKAVALANQAERGEVFIFHQRPEKKILGLFPKKDRRLIHFRNGRLLQEHKYSPVDGQSGFEAESELFDALHNQQSNRLVLSYFGHEIPMEEGEGYHSSRNDVPFNTSLFVEGLKSFQPENSRIDLTILSSCDNLTPDMIHQLQPVTDYVLGSPQNLHLSHIDTEELLRLEQDSSLSSIDLAEHIAEQTYARLSEFVQTAITLTVFDMNEVENQNQFIENYHNFLERKSLPLTAYENLDCSELTFWNELAAPSPAEVFYRPPRFGPDSNKESHSGWGCPNVESGFVNK